MGNHVVLSHSATLGGHVTVDDHANLGGLCAVHQFCRIGRNAMVAGMARLVQHVLPFTVAEGAPAKMRMINKLGMSRGGFSKDEIKAAEKCYKILFMRELKLEDAVTEITSDLSEFSTASTITDFINELGESEDIIRKRGLARK